MILAPVRRLLRARRLHGVAARVVFWGRRRRRVAAPSFAADGRPAGVRVLWRLFLLFGLLHEARDRAAFYSRRGVLRRRAVGAHAEAVLLQLASGSSINANWLRFESQRLKAMETKNVTMNHDGLADATHALTVKAVSLTPVSSLPQACKPFKIRDESWAC